MCITHLVGASFALNVDWGTRRSNEASRRANSVCAPQIFLKLDNVYFSVFPVTTYADIQAICEKQLTNNEVSMSEFTPCCRRGGGKGLCQALQLVQSSFRCILTVTAVQIAS